MKTYLWTLDSHDCFGPFDSPDDAHDWAKATYKTSYTLVKKPSYPNDLVHAPYEPITEPAKYGL